MSTWILETAGDSPMVLRIPPNSSRTIGRAVQADFIVEAALVSRVHCRLTATSDELSVEDLDSTNGMFVNGVRADRAALKNGDRLTVGRLELQVRRE